MDTLLVVVAVAAAALWAAGRVRRAVRDASRPSFRGSCPRCAACDGTGPPGEAAGGAAACPEARGAGRGGPPR